MEIQVILENGCNGFYKVVVFIIIFIKGCLRTPFFIKLAFQKSLKEFCCLRKILNRKCFFNIRNLISIFFLFGVILNSIDVLAQNPEPVYRRYTVDDGLPSSLVYHVFQDSKGYMWFATGNGVSRFDGYKFENFDMQSGLVDNEVFEIYEDYKHRIWFIPMSGKLCYYENQKIVPYKYNNKITENAKSSRGPFKCSFYVDSLDYVYLSLKRVERFSISPEGVLKKIINPNNENNITATELSNRKILISNSYKPFSKYLEFQGIKQTTKYLIQNLIDETTVVHHHLFFILSEDNSIYIAIKKNIVKLKNGKIIAKRYFGEDLIWMSIDEDKNLWAAKQSGGVRCYKNCEIESAPQKEFLLNSKITSVIKDKEGAYWFSTLNDGVVYCSDINVLSYTKESGLVDNRINVIDASREGVYIGYEFGFVDLLTQNTIKHFKSPIDLVEKNSVRRFLIDSTDSRVWISAIANVYWIKDNKLTALGSTPSLTMVFPKKIIKSRFNGYWIGATRGLVKCENDKVVYESYANKEFEGVIYDLVEDENGAIWFCSIDGIWVYFNGKYKFVGSDNPIFAQTCFSIIRNPNDSSMWIGTGGSGIIIKGKKGISHITKEDGLISNSINQMFVKGNNVWVAAKQGLSKIILNNGRIIIKNFTTANGLSTNEVSSVAEYKGIVYVGSPKGLTVFNKNEVAESPTPPSIVISKFRVNNNWVDLMSKKIELAYDQNSLNIDFVGFVYRNAGKVNYRYRMLGVDTAWVQTQTPSCLYNGLSNGSYKFEVVAQSYCGIWSSKPASITFTIHPPFWKRIWFLIFVAIIFSCFIYVVYKVRINEIHRRNNLLQNVNLYKQQSLRQQMNPHFIFNTLNSIQLFILEKDPISSHKYLTKFARLMRMTLDNSLYPTIPLRDEIEALKLYLDLEKLRLEDRFDYSIEFGADETILNYKIPTLLIQPFVENAIWHGISLKKDQMGWVKIKLLDNDRSITCIVEDNGVGRQQAGEVRQLRNKEHKSRGSQITQQRIDLLSSMYKERFSISYDDLIDNQGFSLGTRVSIIIPKEI